MKPKILLIPDTPGWAFDVNLRAMAKYLANDFDFVFWYAENGPPGDCDAVGFDAWFAPWHSMPWVWEYPVPQLGSLRSARFDVSRLDGPDVGDFDLVNRYAGFHVVTQEVYRELIPWCPRVVYLTNPVDTDVFYPSDEPPNRVIACWAGNTAHLTTSGDRDAKGINSIIRPACEAADVLLQVAEFNTCRVPAERMPVWYRRASVVLCASEYEGASNMVMEAMASGLACICTDVGNHREIQESQLKFIGATGIRIVPRTVEAFAQALCEITPHDAAVMGQINAQEIANRWSWWVWKERYRQFVEMAL